MILARMLSYITGNKWSMVQISPHSIYVVNRTEPAKCIIVKKNIETGVVSVSMPLSQTAEREWFVIRFGGEMHAYEYLENIIMDDGEDREQHSRDMKPRIIGVKRKRRLICGTRAKENNRVIV